MCLLAFFSVKQVHLNNSFIFNKTYLKNQFNFRLSLIRLVILNYCAFSASRECADKTPSTFFTFHYRHQTKFVDQLPSSLMGISVSTVLEGNEVQSDIKTICELYSLERKISRKLEEQTWKLYLNALHDECLPIVCAVDKKQKLLLNVDSVASDEIKKKVNEVLLGDYLEELIKLLSEKLNNVLRNTTTGDEESLITHVVFANKSVLRIDLFVYHRRFRLSESLCEYNNILAYFVQVGLLDITKARPQVLIYELTRATELDKLREASNNLLAQAKYIARLYDALHHLATATTGKLCCMT